MEQARLLIAIAISFLVFFLWSVFFAPPAPVQRPEQTAERAPAIYQETEPTMRETPERGPADTVGLEPGRTARRITVDTPLFRMTLSETGAAVVSMVLKEYRETMAADSPNKELVSEELPLGTALTYFEGSGIRGLERALYSATQAPDIIHVAGQAVDVRFVHENGEGIRIEKTYRFFPDTYLVDISVNIENRTTRPLDGTLKMALRNYGNDFQGQMGFQGPSGLVNNRLEQVKLKNIAEASPVQGALHWVAIEKQYFMDSLIKRESRDAQMIMESSNTLLENQYAIPNVAIAPGGREIFDFSLFMGPRSLSVLRSAGHNLDRAINFGWVDFIAKPCLWFMNFIHGIVPNYGVAIIILTIVTRLLFWPLAQISYKSMNEMRKLQPLMQEIREKHKDDKTRINQETMALYRTYKINPLGGCLPMIVQLPVFFALYRMLYQSIELRHAPFFGWINDLSAPDRLFQFGFSIPFMQEPYGIPVLTLIMGASMFLQMKMSPAPGDPLQAKMMMLMPVVFTFIFINFPSGLVLYWLVSNMVSIAQQYYTMKKLA